MNDEFPVSIDLAIMPPETVELTTSDSKKGRSKPVYPTLYITGAENLEDLPREGYAMIHFKRRSITMGERDGKACCSADLEVHEIRLPEKGSSEEMGDLSEAFTAMAKKRGLIGNSDDEMEDEDNDDEEGESLASDMEDDEEK